MDVLERPKVPARRSWGGNGGPPNNEGVAKDRLEDLQNKKKPTREAVEHAVR